MTASSHLSIIQQRHNNSALWYFFLCCDPACQVLEELHKKFGTTTAPDCGIEAVGVHYTPSWLHKLEISAGMETDPSDVINEIIFSTRKARTPTSAAACTAITQSIHPEKAILAWLTVKGCSVPSCTSQSRQHPVSSMFGFLQQHT